MAESVITEDMRKAIGAELNRVVFDIEHVLIRRFTEAVGDPNPIWKEQVPPSLYVAIFAEGGTESFYPFDVPLNRRLDGGGEWEFIQPAMFGDTITSVRRLIDLYEKDGKLGRMLFLVRETTWTNQRNEIVARNRTTVIHY